MKKDCSGYWGIECADGRCTLEVENRAEYIAKNLTLIKTCNECPYNKGCDSCIEKDCPERRE